MTIKVGFDNEGIVVGDDSRSVNVAWDEIVRIVAMVRPANIGYTTCLLLETATGRVVELNEELADWESALGTIEKRLLLRVARPEWTTQLVAHPTRHIELYGRGSSR